MHIQDQDEPRTTDELPVVPDELPDEPVLPPAEKDHPLAGWKAAEPDAFRPAGVEQGDDELPLDLDEQTDRYGV